MTSGSASVSYVAPNFGAIGIEGIASAATTSNCYYVECLDARTDAVKSFKMEADPRSASINLLKGWDNVSGRSNNLVVYGMQFGPVYAPPDPASNRYYTSLHALLARCVNVASVLSLALPDDKLREVETEFFVWSSKLPATIRERVSRNFSDLMEALRDEDVPVALELDSLRKAMFFLGSANLKLAPHFALKDSGNFYLQWFNGANSIVGVTFHPDGLAIWSASQPNLSRPAKRSVEAGERSAETLSPVLSRIAPWAFYEVGDATPRRATV